MSVSTAPLAPLDVGSRLGRLQAGLVAAGIDALVGGVGVGLSAYLLLTAPKRQNQVALSLSVDGANPRAALVAHF